MSCYSNESPLVSIVMPVYNSESFLDQSVGSVLEQTYRNWELILIDDSSTDGSLELLEAFACMDERVIVVGMPENRGVAVARNVGLNRAKGMFIAFIDSDDLWVSYKLELQIDYMVKNDVPITYSDYDRVDERGRVFGRVTSPDRTSFNDMLSGNKIGNSTAIMHKAVSEKIRFSSVGHEDYLFWLEALTLHYTASKTPSSKGLVQYLVSDTSLSSNKIRASIWQWNIYRKHLGFDICRSAYYFLRYVFGAVGKRLG